MLAYETAAFLLQTAEIVQAEGYDGEVSPAQYTAIRFFAGASRSTALPRPSRSFSRSHAALRHKVIKTYVVGGYLLRQKSETDGHGVNLQLSDKGRDVLARGPFEDLMREVTALDTQRHAALQPLLTAVAASASHRRFGVCQDCCYIGGDICCSLTNMPSPVLECLPLDVPLPPDETELPCVKLSVKERACS